MLLRLITKKPETPGITTFVFKPDVPFSWQAGQYLHYILPHPNVDDRGTGRWFTISAPPFIGNPSMTTRHFYEQSSSFKKALFKLEIGDQIEADGPGGDFVIDEKAVQHVFIAGGIGITPFCAMLGQLEHDKKDLNIGLLYLNRDKNVVYKNLLNNLQKSQSNFKVNYYIDRAITMADLAKYPRDETVFYLSGPKQMVEAYQTMLTEMGIEKKKIKLDYFPGY
jgi:ferredoxin-NADP reductase